MSIAQSKRHLKVDENPGADDLRKLTEKELELVAGGTGGSGRSLGSTGGVAFNIGGTNTNVSSGNF
jgi:hypothetical protein